MPLFCRHNRYLAECPICSKGTMFDTGSPAAKRARSAPRARPGAPRGATRAPHGSVKVATGPYASAGPYERAGGERFDVRLERVPGGLRLGSWRGRELERRPPVLAAGDLPRLIAQARERDLLAPRDAGALAAALDGPADPGGDPYGVSAGRSGDYREELRMERVEEPGLVRVDPLEEPELVRVGRWLYRPGPGEWELQEAAVMLPAMRLAEALSGAVRTGLVAAT